MFALATFALLGFSQEQNRLEKTNPSFDATNMERTALYLSQWQAKLIQAKNKAAATGNAIEFQALKAKYMEEMQSYVGREVKWPLRFSSARTQNVLGGAGQSPIVIHFENEYNWPKNRAGMIVDAEPIGGAKLVSDPDVVYQNIEPWMKSLKRGDLVWAKAKIKDIYDGNRVMLEQTTISPYIVVTPKKK